MATMEKMRRGLQRVRIPILREPLQTMRDIILETKQSRTGRRERHRGYERHPLEGNNIRLAVGTDKHNGYREEKTYALCF